MINLIKYSIVFNFCFVPFFGFGQIPLGESIEASVYNRIKMVIKDGQEEFFPELEIVENDTMIASYNPFLKKGVIKISRKALEFCTSLRDHGQILLAFIIGHELSHFLQEFFWRKGKIRTSFLMEHKTKENLIIEKEADSYSLFLCRQAGFEELENIEFFLEKLYEQFQLPEEENDIYPSLKERKEVWREGCDLSDQFHDMFNLANVLTAVNLGQYSIPIYQFLLTYIKTKDLNKNLNVAALYEIVNLMGTGYSYPLTIDWDFSMRRPGLIYGAEELFKIIENSFDMAISLSPNDYDILVNKLVLNSLYLSKVEILDSLKTVEKLPINDHQKLSLKILEGIVLARHKERDSAKIIFKEIIESTQNTNLKTLAKKNLDFINSGNLPSCKSCHISYEDKIIKPLKEDSSTEIKEIYINPLNHLILEKHFSQGTIYRSLIHNYKEVFSCSLNSALKKSTMRGITMGKSNLEYIYEIYPSEKIITMNHSKGCFVIVYSKGLIFDVHHPGKIVSWSVFAIGN